MDKDKLYFEDFFVGQVMEWGTLSITEDDIVDFGRKFDPVPIHTDETLARNTQFGGLIASGWHVASLMQRMQCECYLLRAAVIASPGVDGIEWKEPVRPGDTLSLRVEVTECRASRSRPDRGLIRVDVSLLNQHCHTVMTKQGKSFFLRRAANTTDPVDPDNS